jgi:signal recognition particle receptor subunit beta
MAEGGAAFSKILGSLLLNRNVRILMLGLDGAGKTTVLYRLKLNKYITTAPTIGFNAESLKYRNLEMTIWDVGGQEKIRPLWRHYCRGTDALIFVVDSNDRDRLEEAGARPARHARPCALRRAPRATPVRARFVSRTHPRLSRPRRARLLALRAGGELQQMLALPEMETASVLVLANKQDMAGAADVYAICEALGLEEISGRAWHIQACSAATGDGLFEGLDWLCKQLKN